MGVIVAILFILMAENNPVGWGLFVIAVIGVLAVILLIIAKALQTLGWVGGDSGRIAALNRRLKKLLKYLGWLLREIRRVNREIELLKKEQERARRAQEERDQVADLEIGPVLVAVGDDSMLKADFAAFRAIEMETGLKFQRIDSATYAELKRRLDLARNAKRPFDKLHLAVHANPNGIELGGELIEGERLSRILKGVEILLIAGCESSYISEFLGVVKWVISFDEKISNTDATAFCKIFWTQIGLRATPDEALQEALKWSTSDLQEFIQHSW